MTFSKKSARMTILFDWKKICRAADNKVGNIFSILTVITTSVKPKSTRDRHYKYSTMDFSGRSYLLHPEKLLEFSHCYTTKEIAEYIALASYRNYSEYIMSGDCTLKLTSSPVSQTKINSNRLLQVKNGRIHFLFEEVT